MTIDTNKIYTLSELLKYCDMYNLDFKYFGNNDKGDLNLYLKTDSDKVSVFKSIESQTKIDYLKLDEESAKEIKFQFEKEIPAEQMDIVAIVLKTSDVNIPSGRYTLSTLDEKTKEQDLENKTRSDDEGIMYIIVDNNTGWTLFNDVYLFNKNGEGLIQSLENKLTDEENLFRKSNLQLILNYYNSIKEKNLSL